MRKNGDPFVADIVRQTEKLFENVGALLSVVDSDVLSHERFRWPLWRQIYHMLHSIDKWFINPSRYQDHRSDGLEIAALNAPTQIVPLDRATLIDYYDHINEKVMSYVRDLKSADLIVKPDDCRFSRLELILGQFRHVMYHIGFISECLQEIGAPLPRYYGLDF